MTRKPRLAADVLNETFEMYEAMNAPGSRWATGLPSLDAAAPLLNAGCFTVVSGPTGSGRTSLLVGFARATCWAQAAALFFSLEHGGSRLMERLMWQHAGTSPSAFRSGAVSEADFQNLVVAAGALREARLFIDDPFRPTLEALSEASHELAAQGTLDVILVDGADRITGPGVPEGLKRMALALSVPVVATIPSARRGGTPARPEVDAAFERQADVVLALEASTETPSPDEPRRIVVVKNTVGPTGDIDVIFRRNGLRFENVPSQATAG